MTDVLNCTGLTQHIGKRIRARRRILNMTQTNVGDIVGVRFQQIQKYEVGQNKVSAERLWLIAQALEVPISHFYDGYEAPRRGHHR